MEDVLVVGEALVDIVERLDGSRCEHPGGSPANVALGLARLGRSVGLRTCLGQDDRGRRVREHLESSGVRIAPESLVGERTSTATARLDAHGTASYRFEIDWCLPETRAPHTARALHTGSIAAFLPPGGDNVVKLLEKAAGRLTVSYDPNARPDLMGDADQARLRVEHLVGRSDIVKVSDEDVRWLAPGEDPEEVARAWRALGPSVVVLTRGGSGAVGFAACGRVAVPAPAIEVVDTVGAGDAFMSGLLDHLAGADLLGEWRRRDLASLSRGTLEAALVRAGTVAAITCTRAGANPPTLAEVDALSPRTAS